MTRNGQVHDGSADKFALRKPLPRHRGYPGGVDWHWRTLRLRRRNGAHTGKRLAGKLHEPFERAGGGGAQAPPPPTLQLRSRRTKRRKPTAEASAGANAAESVERRAGAEGNTHQHNTYWTQSQARVPNALERIRQLSPSHTRGRSRMRESRTYGSGRGACNETHVPTATAPRVHHAARRRGGVAARGAAI